MNVLREMFALEISESRSSGDNTKAYSLQTLEKAQLEDVANTGRG